MAWVIEYPANGNNACFYGKYYGCGWVGEARSQYMSNNVIELVIPEIPGLRSSGPFY